MVDWTAANTRLVQAFALDRARQQIQLIQETRENLDSSLETVVGDMRLYGASWAEVGRALGVTKQAASRKYAHVDDSLLALQAQVASRQVR